MFKDFDSMVAEMELTIIWNSLKIVRVSYCGVIRRNYVSLQLDRSSVCGLIKMIIKFTLFWPVFKYILNPNLPEVVRFVDETIDFQSTSDWNEIASRVRGARNFKTRRKTIPRRASLRALKSLTFHRFR